MARLLAAMLRRVVGPVSGLAALSVVVAAALAAVGWADFLSARRDFAALVRAQAMSVRDTVAAAARANAAAAADAQAGTIERLLDNARLLAELDRHRTLTPEYLTTIAGRNRLFRITVLAADGTRERFIVPPGTEPQQHGGSGGAGGPGIAVVAERLIDGGEAEAVTDLHASRSGGARIAGGVRRANGGAILLSIDAAAIAEFERQSSLERLLGDIVRSTSDIGYLVFEQEGIRRAQGDVPQAADENDAAEAERELLVNGRPVLEVTRPIEFASGARAHLHVGMRLDGVRAVERRTAARLAISLTAAAALGVLAIGLAWLHREYGALSEEHLRAREALKRRDRLAAMGELASTVAHEIRNPLNAIAMSAQRLQREWCDTPVPPSPEARSLVGVVRREAQRIDGRVQQFLDFARPPVLMERPVNLADWLGAIVAALGPLAQARHVDLECPQIPPVTVSIDPDQMQQALDNLLRNAIEATPAGGAVTVSATSSPRGHVIEVRDTGEGIAPEHLPKIFDLYFTTKQGGTGVGLAVTHQVVAAHGGQIEVESVPGRGTTMRVRLPARRAGEPPHA